MHVASPALARAAAEYRWLLDRGYASSATLKLVGDKHQMSRDERMILFRGVAGARDSEARKAIVVSPDSVAEGSVILVDGYNQAMTVMHYLAGRPLFVGTDCLTRDAGAAHGRIANPALFEKAIGLLADRLARPRPGRVDIYLDAPVPGSGGHAALFRRLFEARGIEAIVRLERSADAPLKAAFASKALIATGDSAIADALVAAATRAAATGVGAGARLYDAARWAIELAFGPIDFLDLGRLIAASNEAL